MYMWCITHLAARQDRMLSTTLKYSVQCVVQFLIFQNDKKTLKKNSLSTVFPNIRKKWKDENLPLSLGEQQILNVPQCGPLRYRNAFPIHDTLPGCRDPSDEYRSTTDIKSDRNIFC